MGFEKPNYVSKNRYINTRFWSDNFVSELNPLDRYLFLYFLTNEHTNICGIYEIPLRTISFETGIEMDMLKKMIKRLEGKIFYVDGWVYIKNFVKHQRNDNESVRKGVINAKNLIPENIRLKIREIDESHTASDSLSTASEVSEPESELESELELELKPFSLFKEIYPRKENMKKAEPIWKRLSLDKKIMILEDIPKRKEGKQWKEGFIPHPTTYLNGERWNDDLVVYHDNKKTNGTITATPGKYDKVKINQ